MTNFPSSRKPLVSSRIETRPCGRSEEACCPTGSRGCRIEETAGHSTGRKYCYFSSLVLRVLYRRFYNQPSVVKKKLLRTQFSYMAENSGGLFQDACILCFSCSVSASSFRAKPSRQYNETACLTSSVSTCNTSAN